jgi:predicted ATPase/class 3 adenylate cyclase/DNA-binding CsgD family transcriptional regulator
VGEGTFVLPTGTVTLLLGDVEGSTRAWEADWEAMSGAVAELNGLVDELVGVHDGVRPVEQGEGDSFVAAFARARDAVACALAIQRALVAGPLRLRLGVHAGDVVRRDEDNYVGPAVNRAARVRDLAHGGQTVVSQTAADLAADALPEGASLRDLGVHRLRDLSRPERVFQLDHPELAAEFPPLRSLDAHRHNLPVERTRFVGRAAEMAELAHLMDDNALVTLVGAGGCGKTRLALQVAAELVDRFADGVWLADLASLADPATVPTQLGQVFGLRPGPGVTPTEALAAYLADKAALVVLDNCEHLLDAAASLAEVLLSSCPLVHLLATSRQALNLAGEVTWRVPSLTVPPAEHTDLGPSAIAGVGTCEAVQLFADRAGRARPGFAVSEANAARVAEICRRLDGIPLAIELAAARVRVLTPAQIAAGLDDRFRLLTGAPRTALARQQTLHGSIDWSHQLLTDPEQAVFRRLAVFAADFDYGAAQSVCADGQVHAHQVLDLLSLLVDKSLVHVDDSGPEARYRLLETVRHYAAGRLADAGEDADARSRHRDHYLALAEETRAHLDGPGQAEWRARLGADYPNLRAALVWSHQQGDVEHLARQAAALSPLWYQAGPTEDGEAWLAAALEAAATLAPELRARVLSARLSFAAANFDIATVAALGDEGLALARHLGDLSLQSRFMVLLGVAASLSGQPAPFLDEAVALARQADDPVALAEVLTARGIADLHRNPSRARPHLEEAARVADAAGNRTMANLAMSTLGNVLLYQGEVRDAARRCAAAAAHFEEDNHRAQMSTALTFQALALAEADERTETRAVAEHVRELLRVVGIRRFASYVPFVQSMVSLSNGDATLALEQASEGARLASVPMHRVVVLPALVEAELALGCYDDARTHLDEMVELNRAGGFSYSLASGLILRARLCRLEGEAGAAEAAAHDGLTAAVDIDAKSRVVDALELLAGLAADNGSAHEAARLFGAAHRLRDDTGYRRCVSERDADLDTLRATLGEVSFEASYDQGRKLSLGEAVGYARRGRGERKRPTSGWASLTPTEIQVTALVKDGLSNPEIGQRLVCSPRTVQAHLTHIYSKLGLTSRAELAAQTAVQQSRHRD